jgi:uncharacterized protein YbaA (DUF1428 family)
MSEAVGTATFAIRNGWEEEVARWLESEPQGCITSVRWTRYTWEDKEEVVTFWYFLADKEQQEATNNE